MSIRSIHTHCHCHLLHYHFALTHSHYDQSFSLIVYVFTDHPPPQLDPHYFGNYYHHPHFLQFSPPLF